MVDSIIIPDFLLRWWSLLIVPAAAFLTVLLVGYLVRGILFGRLSKWAQKTTWKGDDILIEATRGPFLLWVLIVSIAIAVRISTLPEPLVVLSHKILLALWLISFTLAASTLAGRLITLYGDKLQAGLSVTSLTQNITRIVIFSIGVLILLNNLGISITPLLTALGVSSLAVALALQDTLTNLFAGVHILMGKGIRIGDYIELDSGIKGYVTDITWRATRIRTLPNSIVIIPNAKLSQTVVTNYYLPDKEIAVLVEVGVHYDSDLKKVEQVTCEVGKEVMREVTGGVVGFDPFIRFHTFADSSVNFTVILRGKEFVDQYLVKHEFIKRLHERFKKEGVIIPFPIRTVYLEQKPSS
ncbi:MAG: mechanosensitive ion channel family protein [Candidatus Omnitrophica bacterium]|nr:mechanosensitive ion channel family protein [Candidatus Omnitrophota bacterium]